MPNSFLKAWFYPKEASIAIELMRTQGDRRRGLVIVTNFYEDLTHLACQLASFDYKCLEGIFGTESYKEKKKGGC